MTGFKCHFRTIYSSKIIAKTSVVKNEVKASVVKNEVKASVPKREKKLLLCKEGKNILTRLNLRRNQNESEFQPRKLCKIR